MKWGPEAKTHSHLSRMQALREYYSLEKRLADCEAFDLLIDCGDSFSKINSAHFQNLGAWAYAEAALIGSDDDQDFRLCLLELAESGWQRAHQIELKRQRFKYDQGQATLDVGDRRSLELLHIEAGLATGRVFTAMVEGDISPDVRHKYYTDLLAVAVHACNGLAENLDAAGFERGSVYTGFAHEINAMLVINRLQSPTLMAFPSLPRSDSGFNFPNQTHDVSLFNMEWGLIKRTLPIEVKTTPQSDHFRRYDSVIIGGTMHMHPENKRDPSYLTELLVRDHLGLASLDEQAILEATTERVIHTARHGFGKIVQCRDLDNCQSVPRLRNGHQLAS